MTILAVIYVILFHILAIPTNGFVIQYRRSNWTSNPGGKSLMIRSIALAALVDLTIAVFWLQHFIPPIVVFAAASIVVTFAIVACSWLLCELLKSQRESQRERGEKPLYWRFWRKNKKN